jgi:hypothetical protein
MLFMSLTTTKERHSLAGSCFHPFLFPAMCCVVLAGSPTNAVSVESLPRPEPLREIAAEKDFPVRDFGAVPDDEEPDTAAIRAAIQAAIASGRPARVVFEPGVYRLEAPEQTGVRRDDSDHSLFVKNARDLVLEGNGAKLQVMDPTVGFLRVLESERVIVQDFEVDYEILPFSAGILTKVDAESGILELEIVPPHPPLDLPHFQSDRYSRWGSVLHAEIPGRLKDDTHDHFETESITALGGNLYRITVKPGQRGGYMRSVAVGDRYMQHTRVDHAGLTHTKLSKDITYQRITSYASPGGVYLGQRNERVNILECRALIAPGRWKNANSDGVHFQNERVGPWVENCVFEGLSDDCVNFYMRPFFVASGGGNSWVIVEKPHHESSKTIPAPAMFFATGETIGFFDATRGRLAGQGRVVSFDAGAGRLVLDSPIEGEVSPGYQWQNTQVYNLSMGGGFVLRGNRFANSRRYGVFLKCGSGVIEDNVFEGLAGSAVTMHNAATWPEGLWCRGVTVRNNRISDCGFGAGYMDNPSSAIISVFLEMPDQSLANKEKDFHRDIEITGNTITGWKRSAIRIANTTGLRIDGNRIGPPSGSDWGTWRDGAVVVESSDKVSIGHNASVD